MSATLGPQTIVNDTSDDRSTVTEAALEADFGDGSSMAVTAISETESQVDLLAEGVTVSFIDDDVFQARDDSPGVYGDRV